MWVKVRMDCVVDGYILTERDYVSLFSDPVSLGEWHHLEWWYGPEGSVLVLDGRIQDYSTDWSVSYAYNNSTAFYLGDMPHWHTQHPKGYFSPGDNFIGLIDNLQLIRLEPGGAEY